MASSNLPSFDDLVASLGLPSARASPSTSAPVPPRRHRPSHSRSSSASVLSTSSSSRSHSRHSSLSDIDHMIPTPPLLTPASSESSVQSSIPSPRSPRLEKCRSFGRLRGSRYTPYHAGSLHARRPSLPTLLNDLSLSPITATRRDRGAQATTSAGFSDMSVSNNNKYLRTTDDDMPMEFPASTPISSLLRRRTPQSSPTVFVHQRSSSRDLVIPVGPLSPVTLPTVPFVNALPSPSSTDLTSRRGSLKQDYVFPTWQRARQAGVRISACVPSGSRGRHSPSIPTLRT